MKIYTAHTRPDSAPVLVREGFSWAALVFGPLWLLLHRAWIAAILVFVVGTALGVAPSPWSDLFDAGLALAVGLFGRDLWRWSLDRRGFTLVHVVAGRDEEEALARLFDQRPDLVEAASR